MANSKYKTPIDMLPDEVLNMIFNRLNFHGHLRLSSACTRWKNLVQNDVAFMKTVKFNAKKMTENHKLMRSYKYVDLSYVPRNVPFGENFQQLLRTAERIEFGETTRSFVNSVIPLCGNLKEVELHRFEDNDDNIPLTFNHRLPTRITMNTLSEEFLDHFDVITCISKLPLCWNNVPTVGFMAKYGRVIDSAFVTINDSFDWNLFENTKLQHLSLMTRKIKQYKYTTTIQSFFKQQSPFLKTISIIANVDAVFDPMRMLLKNLEEIKLGCWDTTSLPRFNDLKVLPKLKRLEYSPNLGTVKEYHLDIVELITLTELRISNHPKTHPTLRIVSLKHSLDAMEKLMISSFTVDLKTLEQITQAMPRLKVLNIDYKDKQCFDYSLGAIDQFNKLVHLKSLTDTSLDFRNKDCLGNLSLPELQHLEMYMIKGCDYGTCISQHTLNKLAKNCPKLLRLFGSYTHLFKRSEPFIFAKRTNAAAKFRTANQIAAEVDGTWLKFDYDSVEGYTTDEDSSVGSYSSDENSNMFE